MCFLYRQSISIVYESKFKYIYRYFIKIDRCFCEILQSLPLRKCGLKSQALLLMDPGTGHFPCGSVDWNCILLTLVMTSPRHFPCGSVDWNCFSMMLQMHIFRHFPCGSVDWNLHHKLMGAFGFVTSLAEVWIEIPEAPQHIRIDLRHFPCGSVDWNLKIPLIRHGASCHFPCGSVDWNCSWIRQQKGLRSLPLRKCGLK